MVRARHTALVKQHLISLEDLVVMLTTFDELDDSTWRAAGRRRCNAEGPYEPRKVPRGVRKLPIWLGHLLAALVVMPSSPRRTIRCAQMRLKHVPAVAV